jgi:hypothetical protein
MAQNHESTARSAIVTSLAAAFALSALAGPSSAQELPPPQLGKRDVATLIVDKKISYIRKSDGARQTWDFKGNGTVYWTTAARTRNNSLGGTYDLGDDGVVCFKWKSDRYITLPDNCVLFRRDGEKVNIYDERTPTVVHAEVTE